MIALMVFLAASVGLAVFGVRMLRGGRHRMGEVALGLALLLGIYGVHAWHVIEQRRAGDHLAAACVVLEKRLADGEVAEVREALGVGSRSFLRNRLRFSSATEFFWETAILHPHGDRE